jgi:hypothetical protein
LDEQSLRIQDRLIRIIQLEDNLRQEVHLLAEVFCEKEINLAVKKMILEAGLIPFDRLKSDVSEATERNLGPYVR